MPPDLQGYLQNSDLIVADVNRDIEVKDSYETGSADGLITGRVTATIGSDGRTRYLPLILEANPNIVKSYTDSYLPLLNQDYGDRLIFSLTLGGGNSSTNSWAKVYPVSTRELYPNGDIFQVECKGGPHLHEISEYNHNGVIPPFFISIDTELSAGTDGILYSLLFEVYVQEIHKRTDLLSKRYRLFRNMSSRLEVTTESVNVGNGEYDRVLWDLVDREADIPYLPYE